VALVTRNDNPAGLRDVPEGSPVYGAWHEFVNGQVSDSPGSPWIDLVLFDTRSAATCCSIARTTTAMNRFSTANVDNKT